MKTKENQNRTFTSDILIRARAITMNAKTARPASSLVSNVVMAASVHRRRQESLVAPDREWIGLCLLI